METKELLKNLTSVVSVAGKEEQIVSYLKEILCEYGDVSSDSLNNVYCTFGSGDKHIMLDAHLDEIGLIVTSITDDGFIKVDKCGGIDQRMLLGYEVSVWGTKELKGIISTLPPHLLKGDAYKKAPNICDIAVDVGMKKEEIEKYVSLGDRITFKRNYCELLNNEISASVLDDRSGVASILVALELLKNKKINSKVTVMFSSEEELGTRGAKVGPFGKNVDECISVDVSFGYSNGCDKEHSGILSKGAMIGISPILDTEMTNKLVSLAKENNVSYQLEIMSGTTGTNADVITLCEKGIKCALLSVPEKYMHTPIEVVNTKDVESIGNLIALYVESAGDSNA